MNKKLFIFCILLLFGTSSCGIKNNTPEMKNSEMEKTSIIYTCPMHPEVKQDHPGDCPICHMRLVKVDSAEKEHHHQTENKITLTESDQNLIGVQKYIVKKMDLSQEISIAGRLLSPTSIIFQVYESDISLIKKGDTFEGTMPIDPQLKISGKISMIDSFVDPASRTIRITGTLNEKIKDAKNEARFHGKIFVKTSSALAVPEEAVFHTGKEDLVFAFINDTQVKARPVVLGIKANNYYQILQGINEGEVITTGANFLLDSESKMRSAE